ITKYYINKNIKIAAQFTKALPGGTGTTEQEYQSGKWIKISKKQADFYTTHPTASFLEIINMEMQEIIPPTPSYNELVSRYIREEYSMDDEIAIIRQKAEKPEKFTTYYAFCESCKERAKQELEISNE
ncbi:MAG: hypothetical protein LBL13_07420, partial [Bacteroidales bacterium]|nr:hypothetical protein [Bacteroidales bacterium]